MYQKSLKSDFFDRVIQKIKTERLWDTVYTTVVYEKWKQLIRIEVFKNNLCQLIYHSSCPAQSEHRTQSLQLTCTTATDTTEQSAPPIQRYCWLCAPYKLLYYYYYLLLLSHTTRTVYQVRPPFHKFTTHRTVFTRDCSTVSVLVFPVILIVRCVW